MAKTLENWMDELNDIEGVRIERFKQGTAITPYLLLKVEGRLFSDGNDRGAAFHLPFPKDETPEKLAKVGREAWTSVGRTLAQCRVDRSKHPEFSDQFSQRDALDKEPV